jgi:NAD(P)H-hydrate epimerase
VAYPVIPQGSVGWITEAEMIEVDRVMIDDLGIELLQMMENAGRNLARSAIDLFAPSTVWIAAGTGGNGGGGMVAARHLTNAGVDVTITTTRSGGEMSGVPSHQFEILRRMGVRIADEPVAADLAIDALVGYSLRGALRGRTAQLVGAFGDQSLTLSLDTPSGIDVTTGEAPGAFVSADATMTLALPKTGLRDHTAAGRLLLADISVPRSVTAPLGGAPDFRASPIVELAAGPGAPA